MLQRLLEILLGLPPLSVYGFVAALAAAENVFPPVPADTAVALGAFLSGGGTVSASGIFAVTWVANVASAMAVFAAVRRIGRPFFQGQIGRRLLRPHALERIERLYDRYGTWGIFVSRFIPGVRAVVPPFAGIAGLSWLRAIVPLALASAIWYGTLTWLAATAIRESHQITQLLGNLNRTGVVVLVALVAGGAVAVLIGWRKAKRRRDQTP